jgi:RNA polymerase sigma-70 factor, ECF subfamily
MAGLYARVPQPGGNESALPGSILGDAATEPCGSRDEMQPALVERAMHGDKEAFASLAAESADGCYALAYRILRDPHRAQDAAQRAMVGAWRDLPTLRDPTRFDAWLHRLVVNACYVELRAERRWVARVRTAPADSLPEPDVARYVVARDELDSAFRRLSPDQRAVVVLHHYLGYPLTEIATMLGISDGTARSRLHRAVTRLRAALDQDEHALAVSEERPA